MTTKKVSKRAGYVLIAAGCAFFASAAIGKTPAFFGVGVAFLVIGVSRLRSAQ